MPILNGNANYRKKFDAFRIVDVSGYEPLKQAICCAVELRSTAEVIQKAIEANPEPETLAKLSLALAAAKPKEFEAWIKIAEFVYSKPKQSLEIEGTLSLEQVLSQSYHPIEIQESK